MLGGSIWVAALRNVMGAGLMMTVFLLLDRPRMPMKKNDLVLCPVWPGGGSLFQFMVSG